MQVHNFGSRTNQKEKEADIVGNPLSYPLSTYAPTQLTDTAASDTIEVLVVVVPHSSPINKSVAQLDRKLEGLVNKSFP